MSLTSKCSYIKWLFLLLIILAGEGVSAQTFHFLNGYVYGQDNEPLPFVNIRVRGQNYGTTTDEKGRYTLKLEESHYSIIYSYIGYEAQVHSITLRKDEVQNVWMQEVGGQLNEVIINSKRRDIAWEVMKNASENRDKYNKQYEGSICSIYLRASEITEEEATEKARESWLTRRKHKNDTIQKTDTVEPPPRMSLVESQVVRYFKYPNNFKEIREGYSRRGNTSGLFFTTTAEADLNFYDNLLFANAISDNMLLSPLSPTATLAYKFKLIESYYENEQKIYRIKITPRKTGNALFEGEIWILDSLWCIKAIDVELDKSHMKEYDYFRLRQEYSHEKDSFWVLSRQEFIYKSKQGKGKVAVGRTFARYNNYQFNPVFATKFFNSEVSITTKEAIEKDTGYWNQIRPEPLTIEEQKFTARVDSIKEERSKKEYLDSIDAIYNKLTPQKIVLLGQGHINREKGREWFFPPATSLVGLVNIGGPRVQLFTGLLKRFPNKKYITITPTVSYGVRNKDWQGSIYTGGLYNTFKRSSFNASFGRSFDLVNPYDAYINLLRRSNFYLNENVSLGHSTELFNGFYLSTGLGVENRKSLDGYKFGDVADQVFENNDIIRFDAYRAITASFDISYTPKQLYLRQPLEKIILGSKYPTFGLQWRKGLNGMLKSRLDFDYIEGRITQQKTIGIFGQSNYRFITGKFLNSRNIPFIDNKFMRRGDPYLFTSPLATFQLLDSTFTTFDWFVEGHYTHHFNGFLINKIPFMVKTGIKEVVGAGFMYALDRNYQHAEIFFGFERVFRIVNDRFRLGVYYAVSQSNKYTPNQGFKFSFEYYNKRTNRWNF
jgi:hypothetical protein